MEMIKFYLRYFVYYLITTKERTNYLQALAKGYDCIGSRDASHVLYGSVTEFIFDKTKPPTRHYLTYKEYKESHYPKK